MHSHSCPRSIAYKMHFGIIWACLMLMGVGCLPQVEVIMDAAPSPPACRTAKGVQGVCVARERCDHGPNNIDFTLYAPRGYKRPCPTKEVCCPAQYVIVQDNAGGKTNSSQETA